MSLLSRAKLSARRRLLSLHSITALQQLNLYATKTTYTSQKTQRFTNPRTTQKSSGSSSSFSERIKKPTGELIVWPKPSEIPYQAKVANFVNLIGYVKTPVQFDSASDGKHFAVTMISREVCGEKNSLLIPVVFEGDLAHVVVCHVKENDCVFVSGQLSMDPMRLSLSDSLGKFHVVGENLNFVEGFKRNVSGKKLGASFSGVEIDKPGAKKIEDVTKKADNDENFDQQWKEALERAKEKRFSGEKDWASSSVGPHLGGDSEAATLELVEHKPEKGNEKSGESANKKKVGDLSLDLWRDLLKNSMLWWDYRDHKSKGLVKEKFPDFKHKETGDGLWVNSAPDWVLPGLEKLEFDVKVIKAKQVHGGEGHGERKNNGKGEDSWKNLVENPNKWWDNRLNKRNPRAPDFKHKETGEGLWVSDSPAWALSRLPPSKDGQNTLDARRVDVL